MTGFKTLAAVMPGSFLKVFKGGPGVFAECNSSCTFAVSEFGM
jgi:hypothetical protein